MKKIFRIAIIIIFVTILMMIDGVVQWRLVLWGTRARTMLEEIILWKIYFKLTL